MNFKRCLVCGRKMKENTEKCPSDECPFRDSLDIDFTKENREETVLNPKK